jgi:hypothetical protein
MTPKKYFRIHIDVTSTTWDTCDCYVAAESKEEARKIFDANPDVGDWDDWETHDSEVRGWTVSDVEYDEWMTKHMENKDD